MPFKVIQTNRRRLRELIAYRREHDLSQLEAAAQLGVSQVTWHYIERGERVPSVPLAKKMAKMTGVPAARILGLDAAPRRRA
jgi:DNA-binding XRE family transcriptional regulator